MIRHPRGFRAAVAALLRDRRPRPFDATPEEAEQLRTAALLRAGRPGADLPRQHFVDELGDRLRQRVAETDRVAPLPRRAFLRGAGLAAAAVAAGIGVDRAVVELRDGGQSAPGELVPMGGRWQAVASVADVHAATAMRFSHGPIHGVLVSRADGGVDAVSAVCTHMGCLLDVDVPGNRLACPCHRATFGFDGTPQNREYELSPLPTLRSRVRDGVVEVMLT